MNKKIAVEISNGGRAITIDLGGALDAGCCGCVASKLNAELRMRGIILKTRAVACRLPVAERALAKLRGMCNESPIDASQAIKRRIVQ